MRIPLFASIFGSLLTLTASCNSGVFGVGDDRAPLATLRGRYDGELPADARLRAGVIWAGVPVFVPYCHENGPTPLEMRDVSEVARKGCRDPFEVVPGDLGPSIAFDPTGDRTFEIPIEHLPGADVMVGTLEGRVAYGSIVLYNDLDENEALDLGSRCRRRDPDDAGPEPTEPVIASSFTRLNAKQTRLAYVEGDFDKDSFFYPHPNCTELPPRGFSLWTVGDVLDPNATCSVQALDQELTLEWQSPELLVNLACYPSERESFSRPPQDDGIGEGVIYECTGDGSIAVTDLKCPCPSLRVYSLRGCYDDGACPEPDWDLEAPPGWPCPLVEDQ